MSRKMSMLEVIRETMAQAMRDDPSIVVFGEDIVGGSGLGAPFEGSMGGTFGATKGLQAEFGATRVRDTPISEAGIIGIGVGAAAAGIRPIIDAMWASFTPLAMDQILNQAAKMRYMFGGQASVPLVIRMAMGAGLGAAGQHSDTLYSIFTHVPGLRVVIPSTPTDAGGLLLSAIASDDPVLFFEHMALYNRRAEVPDEIEPISLGQARTAREGSDVTIVGVALMVHHALDAAELLAEQGVEAEVIDMRTTSPLDEESLLASVERTGRLVVVDESPPRCSLAADLAAMVSERAFDVLRAPTVRVTAPDTPVPLSPPLEQSYIPSVERITGAALHTMKVGAVG